MWNLRKRIEVLEARANSMLGLLDSTRRVTSDEIADLYKRVWALEKALQGQKSPDTTEKSEG